MSARSQSVLMLLTLCGSTGAWAQTPTVRSPQPTSPPPKSRYLELLVSSWAGTGTFVGALGALGTVVGVAAGCSLEREVVCPAGAGAGGLIGALLGLVVGPGVGTSLRAELGPAKGLAVWGLGFGSNLVVIGAGTLIGMAVDQSGNTWGLGRAWGLLLGVGLGALAQGFLTPYYATFFIEDRPSPKPSGVTILPVVSPAPQGATAGIQGAF